MRITNIEKKLDNTIVKILNVFNEKKTDTIDKYNWIKNEHPLYFNLFFELNGDTSRKLFYLFKKNYDMLDSGLNMIDTYNIYYRIDFVYDLISNYLLDDSAYQISSEYTNEVLKRYADIIAETDEKHIKCMKAVFFLNLPPMISRYNDESDAEILDYDKMYKLLKKQCDYER